MATPKQAEPAEGVERADQVRRLFGEIAPRYDLLNRLLSLRIDQRWRRRALRRLAWEDAPDATYLDACTGTFDLALELARRPGFAGCVVGMDFALPMLAAGGPKIRGSPVRPVCGDATRLPFPAGTFAGAVVGFGVRNLANLETGLREFRRVLRTGGRLVVLEFTVPPGRLLRTLYMLYFEHMLPRVGRLVSGHRWAYSYLPKSVKGFPDPAGLADIMREAGFGAVRWELATGGVAAIHVATKAPRPAP